MNTKKYKKNNSMKTVPPKKKTIDRNQLLAYLLAVLIIFWTVASVFGLIAYARTKKSNSANVITASAQSVEDFVDNERLIITNPIKNFVVFDYEALNRGAPSDSVTTLFGYDFYFGSNGLGLFDGSEINFYGNNTQDLYYSYYSSYNGTIDLEQFTVTFSNRDIADYYEQWTSIDYYIIANSIVRNGFRHLIFSHRFEFTDSVQGYTQIANFSFDYKMTNFSSDTSLSVAFPNAKGGSHEWIIENGDYESTPSVEGFDTIDFLLYYYSVETEGFDIAYGNGYDNGYEKGRSDARADTYDKGYREGRKIGEQDGFDKGYLKGVEEANKYSFDGLISAVFDVPVRTFFSFFQFEILGVDLSSFFLSLFAIAVFLAVVRFIF